MFDVKAEGGILGMERFKKVHGRCLKGKSEMGKVQPKINVRKPHNERCYFV